MKLRRRRLGGARPTRRVARARTLSTREAMHSHVGLAYARALGQGEILNFMGTIASNYPRAMADAELDRWRKYQWEKHQLNKLILAERGRAGGGGGSGGRAARRRRAKVQQLLELAVRAARDEMPAFDMMAQSNEMAAFEAGSRNIAPTAAYRGLRPRRGGGPAVQRLRRRVVRLVGRQRRPVEEVPKGEAATRQRNSRRSGRGRAGRGRG